MLTALVTLAPGPQNILQGLAPELDNYELVYASSDPNAAEVVNALFRRSDKTTLAITTGVFASRKERFHRLAHIEDMMQLRPARGSSADAAMRRSLSGNPLGDQIYTLIDPESHTVQFTVGAENVSTTVTLRYFGDGKPGAINWHVGDIGEDQALVESLARRVLARMLAFQHGANAATNAKQYVDADHNAFVAVDDWLYAKGIANPSLGASAVKFTYRGTPVVILLGSDRIKLGNRWIELGGYVQELNGRPFAPLKGLTQALR
ncbi:MAG TPA: hypothetical protein VHE55_03935 [Fimbriimonadaceae bacterium]|nr:hypothetical protein [Fimbriimonadaceae bacterium]